MGIFDSDFDIEKYIRQRIPELDNLENRELFKVIVGNSTLELYNHIKEEYAALEKRVFDETPRAARLPDLLTCVIPAEKYDVTDENLFPIFPEDLKKVEIDAQEMIRNVEILELPADISKKKDLYPQWVHFLKKDLYPQWAMPLT